MRTVFGLLVVFVFLATVTESAAAQKIDGAFRLGAGVPIITYTSVTVEPEGSATETEQTTTRFGLLDSAGLGVGYGVSENFVIGCWLAISHTSESQEGQDDVTEFKLAFTPAVEYLFSTRGMVKPYIQLGLGVGTASESIGPLDMNETDFIPTIAVGARAFTSDNFSIDPSFGFGYVLGSGSMDVAGGSIDFDGQGFALALGIEVSGWM